METTGQTYIWAHERLSTEQAQTLGKQINEQTGAKIEENKTPN